MNDWLELLIDHEITYAQMAAECFKTECAWYLTAPTLSGFDDANRAVRLRDDGRGPDAVAAEVIGFFRSRGLRVAADIDSIAEAQGIGRALRLRGITPVVGDRILMRYEGAVSPVRSPENITIETAANGSGANAPLDWIETAISDDIGGTDENLWRSVARCEACYSLCRLYLARLDGMPAATCDLFVHRAWGRIDSVATRPEFRRRGIASALVSYATHESLTSGNSTTYLFTDAGGAAEQVYLHCGFRRWHINPLRRHLG